MRCEIRAQTGRVGCASRTQTGWVRTGHAVERAGHSRCGEKGRRRLLYILETRSIGLERRRRRGERVVGALYSSGVDGERSVGYSRLPYDNEKRGEGRKGEVAKEKERTR